MHKFLIGLLCTSSALSAITTTAVKKKQQPTSFAQEMNARFGNQIIQLTNAEYHQLVKLPPLNQYFGPDRTIRTADLFTTLLSNYRLSLPKVYCIRAPCPQPALLRISNDSISLGIDLTDSDFSNILESFNFS